MQASSSVSSRVPRERVRVYRSPQKVEAETLEALRSATAILAAKAPDEADAYRKLVLDVADSVANAKGGLKPGETAAIDKIRDALGAA